jgi:nucleotide-binding universal stress UspA family protein
MESAVARNELMSPIVVRTPCRRPGTALRYAAREAALHGCGLRLVHAYEDHDDRDDSPDTVGTAAVGTPAQARGADLLGEAMTQAKEIVGPDIDITGLLVEGPPVEAVIDANPDARLVVLEHHDVLNLLRALSRPTAGGTAPHAYLPIAVVPDSWTPATTDDRPVTVGVRSPRDSRLLLRHAVSIARAPDLALRVVHAWTLPTPYDDTIGRRVGAELASRLSGEIEAALNGCHRVAPAVPVHLEVQHGEASGALRAAALDSELVVLGGNNARNPAGSRMGRVPRTFLHESPCPVVLLPSGRRHLAVPNRRVASDRFPDPMSLTRSHRPKVIPRSGRSAMALTGGRTDRLT